MTWFTFSLDPRNLTITIIISIPAMMRFPQTLLFSEVPNGTCLFHISVYNVEKYVRRAIDSLLAQTMPDFEAIFVDDGSPDRSADIISERRHMTAACVLYERKTAVSRARGMRGLMPRGVSIFSFSIRMTGLSLMRRSSSPTRLTVKTRISLFSAAHLILMMRRDGWSAARPQCRRLRAFFAARLFGTTSTR